MAEEGQRSDAERKRCCAMSPAAAPAGDSAPGQRRPSTRDADRIGRVGLDLGRHKVAADIVGWCRAGGWQGRSHSVDRFSCGWLAIWSG